MLTFFDSYFAKAGRHSAVLLVLSTTTLQVVAQDRGDQVWFNVKADMYMDGVYDEPAMSSVRYVFYRGDTISGLARLHNFSVTQSRFITPPVGQPLTFGWVRGSQGTIAALKSAVRVKDGLFATDERSGAVWQVAAHQQFTLPPVASVAVAFEIDTTQLGEGVYRLEFGSSGWEADRPIVSDFNVLDFEIREAKSTPRILDRLARRAYRELEAQDLVAASAVADEMLVAYPESAFAHSLRGEIAKRSNRPAEAAQAYKIATDLIQSGRDKLHAARSPSRER